MSDPRPLVFDSHLDLSFSALQINRDLTQPAGTVRVHDPVPVMESFGTSLRGSSLIYHLDGHILTHDNFPDYMELPPDNPPGANINTWEGTRIEIEATTNMPVERAWLQFSDEALFPERCEELRMQVADGTKLSTLWQPIIRDDGSYPRFYRIQCRTRAGATDLKPSVHSIEIRADQKPEVSTLQPTDDIEVAANAIVPLLIHARDPDFRLSEVLVHMQVGTQPPTRQQLYKGLDRQTQATFDVRIVELSAKPGDVITWWAEARDNRKVDSPSRTILEANRSVTPKLKMIVRAAVPEEEAKQQHEFDKQRAQEKLDELDQQSGQPDAISDESDTRPDDRQFDSQDQTDPQTNDAQQKPDNTEEPTEASDEQNSSGEGKGTGGESGETSDSQNGGENATDDSENSTSDGSREVVVELDGHWLTDQDATVTVTQYGGKRDGQGPHQVVFER